MDLVTLRSHFQSSRWHRVTSPSLMSRPRSTLLSRPRLTLLSLHQLLLMLNPKIIITTTTNIKSLELREVNWSREATLVAQKKERCANVKEELPTLSITTHKIIQHHHPITRAYHNSIDRLKGRSPAQTISLEIQSQESPSIAFAPMLHMSKDLAQVKSKSAREKKLTVWEQCYMGTPITECKMVHLDRTQRGRHMPRRGQMAK